MWLSLRAVRRRDESGQRAGQLLNLVGLLLLLACFGCMWLCQGRVPLGSLANSVVLFALVLLACNNVAAAVASSQFVSLVITPVVIVLQLMSLFFDAWFPTAEARLMLSSTFVALHAVLFMLSYSSFFFAAGFALLYLLLDNKLKTKRYPPFFFKLPGLAKLDLFAGRAALLGLLLLTLAMMLAFINLGRLSATTSVASPARDYTIWGAVGLWVYYVVYMVLRMRLGWVGKRACYFVIVGAVLLLVLYVAAKLLPGGGLHGFALSLSAKVVAPR